MVNDYDRHDEALYEIQLLRRRIDKLRDYFYSTRPGPIQNDAKVPEREQVSERARKEADLNDIKRKLLGGKR